MSTRLCQVQDTPAPGGVLVANDSRAVGRAAARPTIAAFFDGLELIEPGLVPCPQWRPDPDDPGGARDMDEYCALGRK